MIPNIEQVDIKQIDGDVFVLHKGEIFQPTDHIKPENLRVGEIFLHPQGIYKVRKSYGMNAYALSKPVSDVELPGSKDGLPYAGYQEVRGKVTILRQGEGINIEKKVNCKACNHQFRFRKDGLNYRRKAKEHIVEEHFDDGKPDDKIIESMLEEE